MPSPKSSLFRIVVTKNQQYFFISFEKWFKKHSACEKVWWDVNLNTCFKDAFKTNKSYVIQFSVEKTYQNFCELLKIAMKENIGENAPQYTVTIEKEFVDKKDFNLWYEKDKSLLAPLKSICWDDYLQEKAYKEKEKILSKEDFNFRNLKKLIIDIHDKLILSHCYGFTLHHTFYDSRYNLGAQSYLTTLLKATIPFPFIIHTIEQYPKSNEWLICVKYVYGLQSSTTKPELYYKDDFTPEERLDFHNRLISFAKRCWDLPENYAYPLKKMAEFQERIYEDFNSEEHQILKVIEEKEKEKVDCVTPPQLMILDLAGTGLT